MKKIINIAIYLFIFSLYFFTFLMIYDNFRERKLKSQEKQAIELFEDKINKKEEIPMPETSQISVNYNGFTVIGKINIPNIGFNSVIIKEQTYSAMNVGTVKSYGVDINEQGGFVISGHNFRGKTRFMYSILYLKNGNKIYITDNSGKTLEYTVYQVQRYVDPTDTSYLTTFDGYHLTLVTCEDGGKSRIVVKAIVN